MSGIRKSVILVLLLAFSTTTFAQIRIDEVVGRSDPDQNRSRGIKMLKGVKGVLEQYYYDKHYHGIDIKQRFKEAEEKIRKLETNPQIFRVIASLVIELNDSHTRFFPPGLSDHVEYGFSMQMIGKKCFVVDVKKGSDAEAKGMRVGDVLTKIGQYPVTRDTLWVLNYYIYQLEPLPLLPVTLERAGDKTKQLGIVASFKSLKDRNAQAERSRKEKRDDPYKCEKMSQEIIACKLRTFSVEKKFIDRMMTQAAASTKFILDLRGNRGGHVAIEEYLLGHFFDRVVKVSDMVKRDKTESRVAKPVKERRFSGDITVLIDSDSASASEVFARVIQLEKRGKIVGDLSAGAVMTSYQIPLTNSSGVDEFRTLSFYGMNVTVADVIMSDGKRLENVGVSPDYAVGPTAEALAQRADPVLAFAAGLMGVKITPAEAGKLQFLFKKQEIADDDDDKDDGKEKN